MALAVFVTKSNTNGEALWFLRAGCSVVCEYHFSFFCIKYYSKETVKVGNAMISENKTQVKFMVSIEIAVFGDLFRYYFSGKTKL